MRKPAKEADRAGVGGSFDPDKDRYPSLAEVLALIPQHEDLADGPVVRVEVYCLADGSSTFRVWPKGAEEPVVGFSAST
jgi:hypothetical protein